MANLAGSFRADDCQSKILNISKNFGFCAYSTYVGVHNRYLTSSILTSLFPTRTVSAKQEGIMNGTLRNPRHSPFRGAHPLSKVQTEYLPWYRRYCTSPKILHLQFSLGLELERLHPLSTRGLKKLSVNRPILIGMILRKTVLTTTATLCCS